MGPSGYRTLVLTVGATAVITPTTHGWSAGHSLINKAVLPMMPVGLLESLNTTHTVWPPGSGGAGGSLMALAGGEWAESGDTVAGPCAASLSTPCAASAVRAKMALRNYCYAEDSHGEYTRPWPYAIPVCSAGGNPPPGWAACLPGPKTAPWLYHYFTETPPANQGFEGRGGAWYIDRAANAFREDNMTAAALYLSCFAHGLEDRSSPYHNFGGFEAQRSAIDSRYKLTATCKANRPGDSARCFVLFWASGDDGIDVDVPGYTPLLLGADAAAAGAVIGGRMEEVSASSRELTLAPGGYVEQHLKDPDWWKDGAVPSAATRAVMGRMAQLSTRLVADAWYTAWVLSQQNASHANADGGSRAGTAGDDAADEGQWRAAVAKAAAYDRLETRRGSVAA